MTSTQELYKLYKQYPRICTDTRNVQPGCIFFALKGPNFNGNTFADKAMSKGAVYCVIDEVGFKRHERYLMVDDGLKALQELAQVHRRQLNIPVLAITGSNGKTTTKELIKLVLSKKYNTHATQGNLNNQIGVPLTLLSIRPEVEFAVIEMGANHQGEIESYCKMAEPDYALITNVGRAHLEGFGGFEGVKKGKGELYQWINEKGKFIFLNGDNEQLGKMASSIDPRKFILYGTNSAFSTFAVLKKTQPTLEISWRSGSQQGFISSHLIGEYNFENIIAAISVGNYFGVEAHHIDSAIASYIPDNSRSQRVTKGTNKIILDAYNANPSSMEAALRNFSMLEEKNKVIILGDMAELGQESEEEHQRILKLAEAIPHDLLIFVGKYFGKHAAKIDCNTFETSQEAFDWIKKNPLRSKSILIKGSRSTKMETIMEAIGDDT